MNFKKNIQNQKALVFGLGLQGGGVGDARWLCEQGAEVRVTDQKSADSLLSSLEQLPPNISQVLGEHRDEDIRWADFIIKNPGVPDQAPQLVLARQLGKPVYTSIALVAAASREKVIGITGTRGKSTTTALITALLSKAYPGQVIQGGNVAGTSALPLFDQLESLKYLVLELSSFQLSGFHDLKLSPRYAVLTNLYPDHLNRYPDMNSYIEDKRAVFAYQKKSDYLFVNADNPEALRLSASAPSQRHLFRADDVPRDWQHRLVGEHNRENIAAVLALAGVLKLEQSMIKQVVTNFNPLPFRLELIRVLSQVKYVNDTTSTTPTATIKAIHALDGPLLMILGGPSKNLPFLELVELIASSSKVKGVILLGGRNNQEFLSAIRRACPDKIIDHLDSMSAAVKAAHEAAIPGDSVVLSPGFFSFDLFNNEFDRGRQFNHEVAKLPA